MESKAGEDKKRILVVDDEEVALELAEVKLKSLGYDVITAKNGNDCLKIAGGEKPDLILLDIMMPGLDGGDIARLLLENPKTKHIPIIFLTSIISEKEELEVSGKIAGRSFLAKPVETERLSEAIKKSLKR